MAEPGPTSQTGEEEENAVKIGTGNLMLLHCVGM